MAWIEVHQTLGRHWKLRELSELLQVDQPTALGHVIYFWLWCLDYAPDGDLSRFSVVTLKNAAEWRGDAADFVEAMETTGFLDRSDYGFVVHDWDEYGGKLHKRRQTNAERMKQVRAGSDATRATHVRRTSGARAEHVAERAALEKRREEKSREEDSRERTSGAGAPADPGNVTPLPVRAVPKPRASTSALTADWDPPAELLAWADDQGLHPQFVAFETEKFRDHFLSKGEKKADWPAAWRNWLRRAGEFAAVNRSAAAAPRGRGASRTDQVRGEIEEFVAMAQDGA